MGCSSGAAAALIMAWYRTDLYHRVLSYSGTFVNQQWPYNPETPGGAWEFHRTLIPNSPAKPIRIWMHVGDRDLFNPNVMRDDMHDWVRRQPAHGQGAGRQGLQLPVRVRAQRRPLRPRREAADAAAGARVAVEGLPGSIEPGVQPSESLVTWTQVIYALHAFSLVTGILGAATVVGAFLTGWPSIIAVILNYVKRGEVRGTWLESHFRWQIRTFWFGLLWVSLCVLFVVVTLGIGILIAWLPLGARRALVHLPDRARLDGAERPPADVHMTMRHTSRYKHH